MKKMITLKEHIINYAKNKRYFNINDLRKYFDERGIDYKNETEKYVELKNRTVILRPFISSREPKNQRLAKIEKILVDLFMETKRVNLMDREECQKIISNIILNYRINMAEMFDYAERRKIKEKMRAMCMNTKSTNITFL